MAHAGSQAEVLIVGAGPTGLSAAVALARCGVDVMVVERDAGPTTQSRAVWVHPRTIELWRDLGIAEQALERGRRLERIDVHRYARRRGTIRYDGADRTMYPEGLILEQSVTQRLLLDRLADLGVATRWGHAVTGVRQDEDAASVTVRHVGDDGPDGGSVVRAHYVLGSDGASSIVREQLGLSLEGGTYESSFFSADVAMDVALEPSRAHMSLTLAQTHALLPLPGERRWRVVGNFTPAQERRYGRGGGPTGGASLSRDDVESLMVSMRIAHAVERVDWATVYRSHHRMVGRYRVGRVFLAGDAAHIHSPAGGLGMNTGIGDALNLAWKLAAVVRGHARERLLDTYEAERRPVAAQVLRTSDRIFRLQAGNGPLIRVLRVVLLPLIPTVLSLTRRGRQLAFTVLSQIGITYRDAATTMHRGRPGRVRAGDRMPYVRLRDGRTTHGLLQPGRHTVFIVGGDARGRADDVRHVVGRMAVPVTVHELPLEPALAAALDMSVPAVVLVRPDWHIAHLGALHHVGALAASMDRWYVSDTSAFPADVA